MEFRGVGVSMGFHTSAAAIRFNPDTYQRIPSEDRLVFT